MKVKQAFKDIKKPKEIEQGKLNEYLVKLYNNPSFDAQDASYVDNSNPLSVSAYKKRVNLLIDKLVELSGNKKFNQLKTQFAKNVSVGETRTTLDEVKKTAEAMCYKLEHGEITSREKFKAEINSATLSACEDGALTNMQKILYSMDASYYVQKYDYIQNLAMEYAVDNNLIRGESYEVHDANKLILQISQDYNVIPPRDKYAVSLDAKHAKFKEYLDKHFASREGIYSFSNSVANSHLSKLPDVPSSKKFKTKAAGTTNDSADLEQITMVAESLNIPVTSIIEYSEDGKEFEYKKDYMSVIEAATMHDLVEQGLIEHEPLIIKKTETITTPARDTYTRDSNNKLQKVHIPAKTTTTETNQQIIESPDGWYLAEKVGGKVDPSKKLLDTSQLQGLTIDGQNIENYLHKERLFK